MVVGNSFRSQSTSLREHVKRGQENTSQETSTAKYLGKEEQMNSLVNNSRTAFVWVYILQRFIICTGKSGWGRRGPRTTRFCGCAVKTFCMAYPSRCREKAVTNQWSGRRTNKQSRGN